MARDCWEDFAASGRISDYLKYREQAYRERQDARQAVLSGGVEHGADGCPDRHGVVCDACGRI